MTGGRGGMRNLRERIRQSPRYRWFVLVTVAGGMMMSILNSSIVNIALPTIAEDFMAPVNTVTWVLIIFTITQATLMPVSGRAGDIYGHRRLFIAGVTVFAVNSLFCALAWNPLSLIAGRGLQAIGTSAISPMSLAFVFSVFPERERPRGLGIMGGINGIAPTLGLLLGGLLVAALGWRSIFLFSLPLAALIVPAALLVLEETPPAQEGRGFDIAGALMLAAGLFSGLLALNRGGGWGWTSGATLGCFTAFAVLLASFVAWETRAERPMIDLGLFRYRSLVSANVSGFFSSGAMFGSLFLLPFYFQWVKGLSPWQFGWAIAPLAVMFFIFAPQGGRLTPVLGARNTALLGLGIGAAGFLAVSRSLGADTPLAAPLAALALLGIGLALTMAPVTTVAIHDAPADKRGIASSLPQMMRFIGASFVIAVMGSLLAWRLRAGLAAAGVPAEQMPSGGLSSADSLAGADPEALRTALAGAFQDVFLFALVFVALAVIAVAFMPQLKE